MDVIKVPPWWNRKDSDLRPNTVDVYAKRVVRTQKEMINLRKKEWFPYSSFTLPQNSKTKHEFETILQDQDAVLIDIPAAGRRPPSRDPRDKITIADVLLPSSSCPTILVTDRQSKRNNEIELNWQDEKYSTLTSLKRGRLMAERRDTHEKLEKLTHSKSQIEIQK